MKASSAIGLVVAIVGLYLGATMEGSNPMAILSPSAMSIVLGGTLGAVIVGTSFAAITNIPKMYMKAFNPPQHDLNAKVAELVGYAEAARRDVAAVPEAVRLGALETIAATYVPRVAARLAAERPGLDVALTSSVSRAALLDGVLDGSLDAALVLDTGGPLGELGYPVPSGALEHVDVEPVPLALVAAPGHRLAAAAGLEPVDLHGERLLVNVPGCSFRYAGERLFGDVVERVEAGGVPVLRSWAAQGLGLALLPEFAVSDDVAAGTLARLDLDVPALALRLVFRAGSDADDDLRALLYAVVAPDTL